MAKNFTKNNSAEEYLKSVSLKRIAKVEEIADVMNYILNQWGNESEEIITPSRVSKVSKSILK